jgi:hypothetical protein
MRPCDFLVRIPADLGWFGRSDTARVVRRVGRSRRVVGFKDIETFELLVQHGEGLKSLGLLYLRFEPVLDLILLLLLQVLVVVVEMSAKVRTRGVWMTDSGTC